MGNTRLHVLLLPINRLLHKMESCLCWWGTGTLTSNCIVTSHI